MERFCVVVYETMEERKKTIHDVLAAYAVKQNVEVQIRWLKPSAGDEEIRRACVEAQLAFVSTAAAERAAAIGKLLYQENPACALAYYGYEIPGNIQETVEYFMRLFPARPILYLNRPGYREYYRAVEAAAEDEAQKKNRFCWETKGMQYRVAYSAVLYFRSERNQVVLHLKNGEEHAFPGKLSHVVQMLPIGFFVRVHQSYLVNRAEILLIDKGRKTVRMSTGEEIFISKAHYREALEMRTF